MRNDSTDRRYISMPKLKLFGFDLREWMERNFDDACQTHDFYYQTQSISRAEADYTLLKDMQRLVKKHHSKGRKKLGYYVVSLVVYVILRLFGGKAWNANK